tara:strand:- start:1552 stop:2574 length:1023 start_codon:yes stop_codon:yes gene_type:complete
MSILLTGVGGFIGFHLGKRILEEGITLIGYDNLNSYYDPILKEARLKELEITSQKTGTEFNFIKGDLRDKLKINNTFENFLPTKVVNLAAQAGVRYSIDNPSEYIESNLLGFGNILEACRNSKVKHLVYASSSSVYGGNTNMPFSEKAGVDHPVSIYAATKKSNELMAHSYSHLYNLPTTGVRFFTVYGPWGRPDMALFLFTKSILNNEPIKVFNNGQMIRDFTYIDDVIESLIRILDKPATTDKSFNTKAPNPSTSWAPYKVFNIGNSNPTKLIEYIKAIEDELGIKAKKELLPLQQGDVPATESDCSLLEEWIGFKPSKTVKEGVREFIKWYKDFYKI